MGSNMETSANWHRVKLALHRNLSENSDSAHSTFVPQELDTLIQYWYALGQFRSC